MTQISIDKAQHRLSDLVSAALHGQEIVIVREDQKGVKLVPVEATKPRPRFGSAKGLIQMAEDFDAPSDDFQEYMP